MTGITRIALAAVFVALSALAAPAQEASALRKLLTADDSRGWDAVGRLNLGGRGFCTGALIAPDLVLTAAHCLHDTATGRVYLPGEIEFLAGWRGGRATATRRARRAIMHPDFDYAGDDRVSRVARDLALIELERPIRNGSVTPFKTGAQPRKWDEVGVISYGEARQDSPAIQDACHVLARQSGSLVLSCDVEQGSSGAPIFRMIDGLPQIVSIVSAKAEVDGKAVALGTDLSEPLAQLRVLMATEIEPSPATAPKVRRLRLEGGAARSGAKFVRP